MSADLARPNARSRRVDLSLTPPFRLGELQVRPASREVFAPGASVVAEPRVLQVLAAIVQAEGATVSRQELVQRCWEGRAIGDDAIQRAVAKARRLADLTDPPAFTIESIARVGYRLCVVGEAEPTPDAPSVATPLPTSSQSSRRAIWLGGGVAALAAAAGVAFPLVRRNEASGAARELLLRGRVAFDRGSAEDNAEATVLFRQAAHTAPREAAAWGALALALRFEQSFARPQAKDALVLQADAAAAQALTLNPRQPDGVAAWSLYVPFEAHWLETEHRLRAGLRLAPGHPVLTGFLGKLLMSVGRMQEAVTQFKSALGRADSVPILRGDMAFALQSCGRVAEAERVLADAVGLWPRFPSLWSEQFWLYAFTYQPAAARACLAGAPPAAAGLIPVLSAVVRVVETQAGDDIAAALLFASKAVEEHLLPRRELVVLAAFLDQSDTAFQQARLDLEGLIRPDPGKRTGQPGYLFGRATASMRADPRFAMLVADVGLDGYWKASGSRPDT